MARAARSGRTVVATTWKRHAERDIDLVTIRVGRFVKDQAWLTEVADAAAEGAIAPRNVAALPSSEPPELTDRWRQAVYVAGSWSRSNNLCRRGI